MIVSMGKRTVNSFFYYHSLLGWRPLALADQISDADADTRITAELSPDEDVLRFIIGGWVGQIYASLPANEGSGGYAEDYGRVIHFLVRAESLCGAAPIGAASSGQPRTAPACTP